MPSKEAKTLYSLAPCIDSEPIYFDQIEHNALAEEALNHCAVCPVKAECVMIVQPHTSYFDGICGGIIWKNGRPVGSKAPRPRIEEQPDEVAIERLIAGQIDWKEITLKDRRHAAIVMHQRGIGKGTICSVTHISGSRLKQLLEKKGL